MFINSSSNLAILISKDLSIRIERMKAEVQNSFVTLVIHVIEIFSFNFTQIIMGKLHITVRILKKILPTQNL